MRIVIRALSLAAQFVLLTVASAMIIWVLGAIVLGVWELITPVSYEAPVWVLATGLALGRSFT